MGWIPPLLAVSSVLLAACTSPAKSAGSPGSSTTSSPPGATAPTTTTTTAPLLQPPGPISEPPSLLADAARACRNAHAPDQTLCEGTPDAYVWGDPLVIMSATRDHLACLIGINKLYNATTLAGPSSTAVVAPNDDTLYSTAFLDLRAAPEVLTVPAVKGRYVNFQLLDMYTNTFADIGVLTDGGRAGRYAIVGPGWHGTIPVGIRRIGAPTPDVWLLGRTQVNGPADLPNATALQREYVLAPLETHGSDTTGGPSTLSCGASTPKGGDIAILDEISADMAADPPLPQDGPVVRAMAAAGIGPGLHPVETASQATSNEYVAALKLGASLVTSGMTNSFSVSKGWARGSVAGSFGTNYVGRALVAKLGLGEQVPTQAIYFRAVSTASGSGLVGSHRYMLSFAKDDLPPFDKDGFWSVTMYDTSDFLVANPIDRYSIGDHTPGLVRSANGSLEIVMSATKPKGRVNWLPSPTGGFVVSLRVYAPSAAVADGG